MTRRGARTIFRTSLGVIVYLYVLFPLLAALRGSLYPRPVQRGDDRPGLSLIITAHDEESVIEQKLDNSLAIDYPRDCLEIIVASDGSSDRTNELAAAYADRGVRLLALPRLGKNAAMTAAAAASTGDILVFSDADMAIAADALQRLVAPFADGQVGGVAGDRRHRNHASRGRVARRVGWAGRRFRELLSSGGSVTMAGLLYAIRREHFRPLPPNVVDDFWIPAQVLLDGRRLIFDGDAATYPLGKPRSVRAPFRRMLRMNVQYLHSYAQMPRLFHPSMGFYALQLLSHKVLRRFVLIPLVALLVSGLSLWRQAFIYRAATVLQVGFHLAAVIGFALTRARVSEPRLLRRVWAFDRDLVAAVAALPALFLMERTDRWDTHRTEHRGPDEQRTPPDRS